MNPRKEESRNGKGSEGGGGGVNRREQALKRGSRAPLQRKQGGGGGGSSYAMVLGSGGFFRQERRSARALCAAALVRPRRVKGVCTASGQDRGRVRPPSRCERKAMVRLNRRSPSAERLPMSGRASGTHGCMGPSLPLLGRVTVMASID